MSTRFRMGFAGFPATIVHGSTFFGYDRTRPDDGAVPDAEASLMLTHDDRSRTDSDVPAHLDAGSFPGGCLTGQRHTVVDMGASADRHIRVNHSG